MEKEVEAADCLRTFDSENIPCDVYTRLIRQNAKCILSAAANYISMNHLVCQPMLAHYKDKWVFIKRKKWSCSKQYFVKN